MLSFSGIDMAWVITWLDAMQVEQDNDKNETEPGQFSIPLLLISDQGDSSETAACLTWN